MTIEGGIVHATSHSITHFRIDTHVHYIIQINNLEYKGGRVSNMTHDWFTHPALCPDNVTTDAKPIGKPEARGCEWM